MPVRRIKENAGSAGRKDINAVTGQVVAMARMKKNLLPYREQGLRLACQDFCV